MSSKRSATPAAQTLARNYFLALLELTHIHDVKMCRSGQAFAERDRPKRAVHAAAALLTRCVASDDDGDAAGGGTLRCSLQMVPAT